MSRRVSFSPDIYDKPTISLKHSSSQRIPENRKRVAGIFNLRLPKSPEFSPVRFIRSLGAKVVSVVGLVSIKRSSSKVSSSSFGRSRSFVASLDSQRTEAIEDCIEFINSSYSLQRSNSVSADSC